MDILSIAILSFALLESSNVFLLYFKPESKKGNAMGVFNRFNTLEDSNPDKDLINYLVNWVAGSKLIFICLLIMISVFADQTIKVMTVVVLILSIISYFWRLSPLIKKMDANQEISPKGYSKTLDIMIGSFIGIFLVVLAFHFFS